MRCNRPVIAVTGPDRGGTSAWLFTALAILRAGGWPRRFTPGRQRSLEDVRGVIIGGGSDVSPTLYTDQSAMDTLREVAEEEEKLVRGNASWSDLLVYPAVFLLRWLFSAKESNALDPPRDEMELRVLQHALDHHLPVMGICRGSQLLNVHLGGNLHQNLDRFYEETPQIRNVFPRKKVFIEADSLLARTLRRRQTHVNALHNQAVNETGDQVEAVAHESTGVIQGIEYLDRPYVIGVQWHPEYMPQIRSQVRLFERLVAHSRDDAQET